MNFKKNYGINVKITRFHNIYAWEGGKEKVPAAICRKVAMADNGGTIEIWGDGKQTRSFLYIDACIEGLRQLVNSDQTGPFNHGSEEMVSINQLAEIVFQTGNKKIHLKHIPGPLGVRGRNSDNNLIREKLGYDPQFPLKDGIAKTYTWINEQVKMKYRE